MNFIELDEDLIGTILGKLEPSTHPKWGKMNAQEMIEHLSDVFILAKGEKLFDQVVPDDKVEKAQRFISSEHPMPKNFAINFIDENSGLRNLNLSDAIEEFNIEWKSFEAYYELNPLKKHLHPNFGELDYDQWRQLHSKHMTHHFEQFGLLKT
jgi:hypothetical protein